MNWLDLVLTLPTTVQTALICKEQTSCMSLSDTASHWNCYNLFGYKLHNYVTGSCINLTIKIFLNIMEMMEEENIVSLEEKACLALLIPQFLFMAFIGLTFLLTHVLPMVIIYVWILIILIIALLLFQLLLAPVVCAVKCSCDGDEITEVVCSCASALFTPVFAIIYSTLFNYFQYFYYGENYLRTIEREYASRDTDLFVRLLHKSLTQKWHTILSFL